MVERQNGKGPYNRRTHGSQRRGVFSVPSAASVGYQREQSLKGKAELLEKILTQHRAKIELASNEEGGLGNKNLPSFNHKQEIVETIELNKAVILSGETGCGKSTQVPQYLYEAGYEKVYVLVPRRVIADGLSDRIQEELTAQLGERADNLVGVIHGERVETHQDNGIIVMTSDTFNGMLLDIEKEHSDKKVAIISDEIHEANLFTEIATGLAAVSVKRRDNWRLIASSATHNIATLIEPFRKIIGSDTAEVPLVNIEGRPFKVELKEEYSRTPMEVYALLEEQPDRTMIFTSGKKEIKYVIEQTRVAMEKYNPGSSEKTIFRVLHGELTESELSHINDPVPEGYKLVIVSSPAGMSGITIPGVTHVITDGTINRSELDADGVSGLRRHYLSRAGVMQQIGRAGRDVSGAIGILAKPIDADDNDRNSHGLRVEEPVMPFVPLNDNKNRLDYEPAEIYHSSLGRVVLRLAALDRRFNDINDFIPHKVEAASIINAEQSLNRIGGLDDADNITKIGLIMNKLPVSPEISRGLAEAMINNRPIQHLGRMAIIAAAAEQGGLQDFSSKDNQWQSLIRPTTQDDLIAQLDIATVHPNAPLQYGRHDDIYSLREYDLHPKKIERAQKCVRKIFKVMNIRAENFVPITPTSDEEILIRRDFTAGMVDLVYASSGTRNKKRYYRNIHGSNTSTERYISRSVAKLDEDALVAGFPRWFEKHISRNVLQHHDVVEQVFPVKVEDVVHFATQHGIVSIEPLPPKLTDDVVAEQGLCTFGSIRIGKPFAIEREGISLDTQKIIVRLSLERQGPAQKALRSLVDELKSYRNIISPDELSKYRKSDAPEDITPQFIETLLHGFAKETRSLTFIDRKIAYYMYSKGIGINRYYDEEARYEMQQRSPRYIRIGDSESEIFYDHGTPYIRKLSRHQEMAAREGVYLPDGREVLLQISRRDGKYRMSLKDV